MQGEQERGEGERRMWEGREEVRGQMESEAASTSAPRREAAWCEVKRAVGASCDRSQVSSGSKKCARMVAEEREEEEEFETSGTGVALPSSVLSA